MHYELRNIIEGTGESPKGNFIQTVLFYLRKSETTSRAFEKSEFIHKKDEVENLIIFANENQFWYPFLDEEKYIGEGSEQKVFLTDDGKHVIKINDTIFYETWKDYFVNLLIHNFLFPTTAYQLLGFYQKSGILYAVVKQLFIESTEPTDLAKLRLFLESNGFQHRKNNDYFNTELGIILEDLHDENVLTNQSVFFFIDTVIYLIAEESS